MRTTGLYLTLKINRRGFFMSDEKNRSVVSQEDKNQQMTAAESRREKAEFERLDFSKKSYVLMAKFIDTVNKSHLLEYIELVNSPKKLFYRNFLAGIGKGLGLTVGTAIVLGVLFKIFQHMIALNIPYINEWLLELANLIKTGGK